MSEKKSYVICIEEILRRHIIIRASDEQEALRVADVLYTDKGEIVLDADDYYDNNILCEGVANEIGMELYVEYLDNAE